MLLDGRHSREGEAEITSAHIKDFEGRPTVAISGKRGAEKKNDGSSRKLALKKETVKDLTPGARGSAAKGGTTYVVGSRVSLSGYSLSSGSLSSYSGYSKTI
jgi:hypothetical protein